MKRSHRLVRAAQAGRRGRVASAGTVGLPDPDGSAVDDGGVGVDLFATGATTVGSPGGDGVTIDPAGEGVDSDLFDAEIIGGTAAGPGPYDPILSALGLQPILLSLRGDGVLDLGAFHPAILSAVMALGPMLAAAHDPGGLCDRIAGAFAASAFADAPVGMDGRVLLDGRSRSTAQGCAALARVVVADRVVRALREVLRRRALIDHAAQPCWPAGYHERKAAEVARREAAGIVPPRRVRRRRGVPAPAPSPGSAKPGMRGVLGERLRGAAAGGGASNAARMGDGRSSPSRPADLFDDGGRRPSAAAPAAALGGVSRNSGEADGG